MGAPRASCRCTPDQINRYQQRISGPLLDRIDLHIEVTTNTQEVIDNSTSTGPSSTEIRKRVVTTRTIQKNRQGCINAHIPTAEIESHCYLTKENQALIRQAIDKLNLSPRAYHRVLKIARTIADLEASRDIESSHLMEALSYRKLDRGR